MFKVLEWFTVLTWNSSVKPLVLKCFLSLIFSCIGESCSDRWRWTSFETPATRDQLPGPFYKGESINICGFLYLTWCCRNIFTIWGEEELKSIPIYFLTVLEVRSLKSGFPQGWVPFRGSEEGSLLPLPAPGGPRHLWARGHVPPVSTSIFNGLLQVSVAFLLLTRTGPPSSRMTSSYLDYICPDPVSKKDFIYRSSGWGCGHIVSLSHCSIPHKARTAMNVSPWRLTGNKPGLWPLPTQTHGPRMLGGNAHHSPSDEALVCLLFRVPKLYDLLDGALETTGSVSGRSLFLGLICWVCCLQSHRDERQLLWEVRIVVQRKTQGTFSWFMQYCVCFCCTAKRTHTCIHFFLDSFSVQLIMEYWVKFPVLYSCILCLPGPSV